MRILFLAAEMAPLVKVGGLADVVGSLPKALAARGHEVRVAIPGYGSLDWIGRPMKWRTGFPIRTSYGLEHAEIYETEAAGVPVWLVSGGPIPKDGRIYGSWIGEDAPKFTFFSLAALWATQALDWKAEIAHAHDFHAAPSLWWLATQGHRFGGFREIASVFTIHNLGYAGQGAGRWLGEYGLMASPILRGLPEGFRDSMLALGILGADILSTVSPTYAREILTQDGGKGLDGLLRTRQDRLHGILNGIDTEAWDPKTDTALAATFDAETLDRRGENRRALQEAAGLAADPDASLLGVVSRLDHQKGLDIAIPGVRRWLEGGGQFVLLGTGEARLERDFAQLEPAFPGRASVRLRFDGAQARRIYGGADALLIPSRYEPCGLTQMIAMRYGAVPIVRRTGGLADTVVDFGDPNGNGVMFDSFDPLSLADALDRAWRARQNAELWRSLQRRGMAADFSWDRSASLYEELYARARALRGLG
ncbi:MAG TPA: glycogen synthase [Thermoanaerobaculia bacterium]|jgi:starch synthase